MSNVYERSYSDAMVRLIRLNMVVAIAIWGLHVFSVRDTPRFAALVVLAALASCAFNGLITRWRGAVNARELVRTVVNATTVVVMAHVTLWPRAVWLWVPFTVAAFPDQSMRMRLAQFALWVAGMSGVALLDGYPMMAPLIASTLALYLLFASRLQVETIHDMLARGEEQRRELQAALAAARESEGKFASVVEHTDDIICSLDVQLRLVTMNGSFRALATWLTGVAPPIGTPIFEHPPMKGLRLWEERCAAALRGERVLAEQILVRRGQRRVLEVALNPIYDRDTIVGLTFVAREITARRAMEERAETQQRQLLEISRKAGMAELASSVLHNIGNVLNSVNVSASVVRERLRDGHGALLGRVVELLRSHEADLPGFFAADPRARKLPELLAKLDESLRADRDAVAGEIESLRKNIDHIKAIVNVQQAHAKAGGVVEPLDVAEVIEDAIAIGAASDARYGVQVVREVEPLPRVPMDRHKLLQILTNLMANARHAVRGNGRDEHRIVVRLRREDATLVIAVEDNGYGIPADNLPKIFSHGFTTKPEGHGFGLCASAAAAGELGGSLEAASPAPGAGATFTLRLPFPAESRAA